MEKSHLPVRRTLDKLGIPNTTFYRWYDRYQAFGEAGLEDRTSGPGRIWNRIPDDVRYQIVELALDEPELSPRELSVKFTDEKSYFVSEAPGVRLLRLRQGLKPVGDLVETFCTSTFCHARIHVSIFVGLAGYRRLKVVGGAADRLAGGRIATFL